MEEILIWVNEQDEEIGYGEKIDTHHREQLHRAFSFFLYHKEEQKMLIQQRAEGKYHSGGLWTNACCSHPRKEETLYQAIYRRVKEELGIDLKTQDHILEIGTIKYYQKYDNCAENEIDHVFIGYVTEYPTLKINPNEIANIMWISIPDLKYWLEKQSSQFTAWFPKAFELLLSNSDFLALS